MLSRMNSKVYTLRMTSSTIRITRKYLSDHHHHNNRTQGYHCANTGFREILFKSLVNTYCRDVLRSDQDVAAMRPKKELTVIKSIKRENRLESTTAIKQSAHRPRDVCVI